MVVAVVADVSFVRAVKIVASRLQVARLLQKSLNKSAEGFH